MNICIRQELDGKVTNESKTLMLHIYNETHLV